MTKFQEEIVDAIALYEDARKEAIEKGNWKFADECHMHIKRLNMSFQYALMNGK